MSFCFCITLYSSSVTVRRDQLRLSDACAVRVTFVIVYKNCVISCKRDRNNTCFLLPSPPMLPADSDFPYSPSQVEREGNCKDVVTACLSELICLLFSGGASCSQYIFVILFFLYSSCFDNSSWVVDNLFQLCSAVGIKFRYLATRFFSLTLSTFMFCMCCITEFLVLWSSSIL